MTKGELFDFGAGQFGHEYAGEIVALGKGVEEFVGSEAGPGKVRGQALHGLEHGTQVFHGAAGIEPHQHLRHAGEKGLLLLNLLDDLALEVGTGREGQHVEQGMQVGAHAEGRAVRSMVAALGKQEFQPQKGAHPLGKRLLEHHLRMCRFHMRSAV